MIEQRRSLDDDLAGLAETERTVAGFVAEGLVPGVVLAWQKDGGPVRYHGVGKLGFESAQPVDEHSIFRIYSQTKPITGIGAMMLIEDGVLTLDQPLADILPAFREMRVLVADGADETRPAARPITIRHLLTHTAGFGMAGMTLNGLYLKHGILPGTSTHVAGPGERPAPRTLVELGERLAALPLAADPGVRFDYSIATDILGLVIQTVSGLPFETFLKQRLFDPLRMIDTTFTIAESQTGRFATLPEKKKDGTWTLADDPHNSHYRAPHYPGGGGGLVSTALDYARFAAMLLNEGELDGVRVLKPETVRLARSNLLPRGVYRVDLPLGQTLSGAGFGAAMSVQLEPGHATGGAFDWPGAVPAGVYGWPGAGGTACWIDPARRFFLLFLTQYWPSWINGTMRPQVIAAAYRDLQPDAVGTKIANTPEMAR